MWRALILGGAVLAVWPGRSGGQQTAVNRDRSLIRQDEIAAAQANTAFDVIEKLRPEYFRRAERPQSVHGGERTFARGVVVRRPTAQSELVANAAAIKLLVFVDGTEVGDARELNQIPAAHVEEIRYLSGPDAQIRLGPRYAGGVVYLRRKP